MTSLDEVYSQICESIRRNKEAYRQAVLRWCEKEVQRYREDGRTGEPVLDDDELQYMEDCYLFPVNPTIEYQFSLLAAYWDWKTQQQPHSENKSTFSPEGFVVSAPYLTLLEACTYVSDESTERLRDYLANVEKELSLEVKAITAVPPPEKPDLLRNAIGLPLDPLDRHLFMQSVAKEIAGKTSLASDEATDREAIQQPEESRLTPAIENAWLSWKLAEDYNPGELTDQKAYDWLREQEFDAPLVGYKLPAFDTWSKYVRAARKHYGEQKNQPRAGRATGPSVVWQSEI